VVLLFGHVVTAKELWLFAMFQRMAKQAAKTAALTSGLGAWRRSSTSCQCYY
jgi:hypothetical protein